MSRQDLVDVTYDAAEALNTLKLKYARIDTTRGQNVAKRVSQARDLKNRLRLNTNNQEEMSSIEHKMLLGEIHDFSISTVCDKRELFWRRHLMSFKWLEILRVAISFFSNSASKQLTVTKKGISY